MNKSLTLICLLALQIVFSAKTISQEYAGSSVLKQGKWLKVKIVDEGVVRVDWADLAPLALDGSDPVVYGNNNGILSFYNDNSAPDDLDKIAIKLEKGSDGIFNQGDYLLFYAGPTHRWNYTEPGNYNFKRHFYSDTAVYFITSSSEPRLMETESGTYSKNTDSFYYDYLFYHEQEDQNILKSGREWYQPVSPLQPVTADPGLENYVFEPGEEPSYRIRVLARSGIPTLFRLSSGASTAASIGVPEVNLLSTAGTYARSVESIGSIPGFNGELAVSFHNNGDNSARGWLDYLQVHARVRSKYNGHDFILKDYKSAGEGNITRFSILTSITGLSVWDITSHSAPVIIPTTVSAGEINFTLPTDSLKSFIVFTQADILSPDRIEVVNNQDLHSASGYDMIIITHPLFRESAGELAGIHSDLNGYNTLVVTPEEIYNEFSGGVPDISALRNFVRMVWSRGEGGPRPLRNLLLFGDGSYENITPPPSNPSFIPTYQTQNSNINILSFTSDDYYGLLDPGEGESTGNIDIGIGRLPVSDRDEADAIIGKIRRYTSEEATGPWRNIIAMAADDEDNNLHMSDAEALSNLVGSLNPEYNIDKIYFDSYAQETSINGDSYPAATRAINDRISDGCLIFNYLGHGNELGLAHERVVKIEDINSWQNRYRMPVFITATCEFSRYDDIEIDPSTGSISKKTSAGEMVLLNPDGGGIALLTTTRIVYSAPNYILNNRIYQYAFTRNENGEALTLGEIVRLAKNNAGPGDNKRSFTLLGDPALIMSYPQYGTVVTDSINGVHISELSDTIKALSTVTVSGHIEDVAGVHDPGFEGMVNITFYDKEYNVSTLANDGGNSMEYGLQDRILFKGKAIVTGGNYTITFLVPRDIDYSFGNGKISLYAYNYEKDFTGYNNEVKVGGFNNIQVSDTSGPEIRLFMNDTLFRNGGITGSSPYLLALLKDDGGINTSGTGIGHDIVAYLDNDRTGSTILNNYFENDPGSYTSGSILFKLSGIEEGRHEIILKAWDNFNNSGSEKLVFIVEADGEFTLNRLLNFPNPFTEATSISVEHNRPGEDLDITIDIISNNGRLIKRILTRQNTAGYNIVPIIWDGIDDSGNRVARGIYLYTVTIKSSGNEAAKLTGRMVIL